MVGGPRQGGRSCPVLEDTPNYPLSNIGKVDQRHHGSGRTRLGARRSRSEAKRWRPSPPVRGGRNDRPALQQLPRLLYCRPKDHNHRAATRCGQDVDSPYEPVVYEGLGRAHTTSRSRGDSNPAGDVVTPPATTAPKAVGMTGVLAGRFTSWTRRF